jgi:hypothetical protein
MALQLWCENKELKKQQVVHFEMQCDDDNIDQHKSQNKNIANKTNKKKTMHMRKKNKLRIILWQ